MKIAFVFAIVSLFLLSMFAFSQILPDKLNDTDIISVAFSPDSSMLAIKVPNGIHLYDPNSLLEITFIETSSSLTSSNFSPDGAFFACGSKDSSLIIMDVKNRIELATLTGHPSKISCASFSPDGNLLASGSEDGTIKLWDAKTRLGIATFKGQTGKINSLSFSANGKFLMSTDSENTLKLWDPKTYQELATLKGRLDWSLSPNFTP
ncbi:MAG: WD40 repeat domain-containing protein, partial [Candidatus Poribacteria bacterium]